MSDFDDGTMGAAADAFSKLAPAPTNAQIEEEDRNAEEEGDLDNQDDGYQDTQDVEGEQPEAEDDEQDDEPEAPAIDPPVSWDAEAKKVFSTLPPEAQQVIAARESEREKFVQTKATEAAQHRKAAETVTEQYTSLHRQFAEQLDTYAKAFEPQRPDYGLLATDPQAYAQQAAYYEQAIAQRNQLAQQAEQARSQAEQIEQHQARTQIQAEIATIVEAIPEWTDDTKRGELLKTFEQVGRDLGYPDELLAQARAVDIIGLKRAAEWKAKAEKYDALQGSRMAAVRAAKGKPKVSIPGVAQPKGSARAQGLQDSMQSLRKTGSLDDAAAAFRNLR